MSLHKCPKCKKTLRMHLYVHLSAPASFYANLSKTNLRKKDVYLMAALWETASFFCENSKCGGYYRNGPKHVRLVDNPEA